MLVVVIGKVVLHEVRQSQNVLHVVATRSSTLHDLVGDVGHLCLSQPERILRSCHVQKHFERFSVDGVESGEDRSVPSQLAFSSGQVGNRSFSAYREGNSVNQTLKLLKIMNFSQLVMIIRRKMNAIGIFVRLPDLYLTVAFTSHVKQWMVSEMPLNSFQLSHSFRIHLRTPRTFKFGRSDPKLTRQTMFDEKDVT